MGDAAARAVAQQRAAQAEERLAELKALLDTYGATATHGVIKPKRACYPHRGRSSRGGNGYARLGEKVERASHHPARTMATRHSSSAWPAL
jgi:hypothetical protein